MYIKKITYVGYFGMDYKLETSQISAKENFIKEIVRQIIFIYMLKKHACICSISGFVIWLQISWKLSK